MASNSEPQAALRQDRAFTSTQGATRKIPYAFAPVPLAAFDKLKPGPFKLLSKLISIQQPGGWCWASNDWLAEQLATSRRSVISWAGGLVESGIIERHRVPSPDPDHPANKTGWRWVIKGIGVLGAGVQHASPQQACRGEEKVRAGVQKTVRAGVQSLHPNLDLLNSEETKEDIDRSTLSVFNGETEDADAEAMANLANAAFEEAQRLAAEWDCLELLGFLADQKREIKAEIVSEHARAALLGAVKATANVAAKKKLRSVSGHFWDLLRKYKAGDVPPNIRSLKSRKSQDKIWKESLKKLADEFIADTIAKQELTPEYLRDATPAFEQWQPGTEIVPNNFTWNTDIERRRAAYWISRGHARPSPFNPNQAALSPVARANIMDQSVEFTVMQEATKYKVMPERVKEEWEKIIPPDPAISAESTAAVI